MRLACFASVLIPLVALAACGKFEAYRVYESGTGVYATKALPETQDGYTVCLADRPLQECPRSRAIFYSYRGVDGDIRWIGPNLLLIRQVGGEMETSIPAGPIEVAAQRVTVRLEYSREADHAP